MSKKIKQRTIEELIREEISDMKFSPFCASQTLLGKVGRLQVQLKVTRDNGDLMDDDQVFCQKDLNRILKGK